MAVVHLLHGFNVADGGARSVGVLRRDLHARGAATRLHATGWKGPLLLHWRHKRIVAGLLPQIEPGDVLIGHSNAAWVIHRLVQAGAPVAAVVVIQPALRRDTWWPPSLPVLCVYNRGDWVVELGRAWGRLMTRLMPSSPHGWGAAGRRGFTAGQRNVVNLRTDGSLAPIVRGHSAIFDPDDPAAAGWRKYIAAWVCRRVDGGAA